MGQGTVSAVDDDEGAGDATTPHLFLALQAHDPQARPVRLSLARAAELVIGRGERLGLKRESGQLHLEVPDPWMSTVHARLVRRAQAWTLHDAGSKNGTLVNGVRLERSDLAAGDVLEIGQCFFTLRPARGRGLGLEGPEEPLPGLPTILPALAAELARVAAVAPSSVSLVVGGETGTGKELLARGVHARSGRAGEFVAVNCGALPAALAESELFGYRKGAFSGATEDRPGLVRAADAGTLFLDEIGDLAENLQAVLLRVLQERAVVPLGATRPIPVDFRLVSATHRNLGWLTASGRFRHDLLRRLAGLEVRLPPLRERREDIGLVAAAVLRRRGGRGLSLHRRAARLLMNHAWPGNARELETALATAAALAGDGIIRHEQLTGLAVPAEVLEPEDVERKEDLIRLLRAHGGNIAAVARELGKARMQVHRWLKRYALDPADFR